MEKHKIQTTDSLENFEHKAGELVSLMLSLTEERFRATPQLHSPTCKTQASAALAVKHSLDAFMAIAKLEEKQEE